MWKICGNERRNDVIHPTTRNRQFSSIESEEEDGRPSDRTGSKSSIWEKNCFRRSMPSNSFEPLVVCEVFTLFKSILPRPPVFPGLSAAGRPSEPRPLPRGKRGQASGRWFVPLYSQQQITPNEKVDGRRDRRCGMSKASEGNPTHCEVPRP